MPKPSAFDKTRAKLTKMGVAKKDKVTISEHCQASAPKNVVGDRILDAYPDRNSGETAFPIHASRTTTPELDNFCATVRHRIIVAIHEESFCGGAVKSLISSGHGSVLNAILHLQLCAEATTEQQKILRTFGRTWARAVGDSSDQKAYPLLDNDFIAETGLATAAEKLTTMFEEDFKNKGKN